VGVCGDFDTPEFYDVFNFCERLHALPLAAELKRYAVKNMITEEIANRFAQNWIDSWNSHDLDRIMTHYDEDVEYYSAFVVNLTGIESGKICGKENVRNYLKKGLNAYPDLYFELKNVFLGVSSIILQYKSVNNLLAAEVFELNKDGLAQRVQCHYIEM
jgi:hypothetical protein